MTYVEPLEDRIDFENDKFTMPSSAGILTQDGAEALMNMGGGMGRRINEKSNSSFHYYTQDKSPIQHQKERQVINDELEQIYAEDCS